MANCFKGQQILEYWLACLLTYLACVSCTKVNFKNGNRCAPSLAQIIQRPRTTRRGEAYTHNQVTYKSPNQPALTYTLGDYSTTTIIITTMASATRIAADEIDDKTQLRHMIQLLSQKLPNYVSLLNEHQPPRLATVVRLRWLYRRSQSVKPASQPLSYPSQARRTTHNNLLNWKMPAITQTNGCLSRWKAALAVEYSRKASVG